MVVARPRDAVAWALYYPPILTALAGRDAPARPLPPGLRAAVERVAANDYVGALDALEAVPEAGRDARYHTYLAGVLLNVGRVEEAQAAIERALALDPEAGDALAQRAIIQVVQNRNQEALADARRAVILSPDSAAAAIALSYALQAAFQLEEARDVLRAAVERNPEDALAWARLAELEQMFGNLGASRDAAEQAVALAPDLARTQMVLGFAALTRIDISEAKASFERAIELDSANPLPRLGLGLAVIRSGRLADGRKDIETATALDPNDSLIRSYLGKAYFEEKRAPLDAEQYAIAKELDPNDPTPWFYDAIRLQTENRPVEALRNIQRSIELNENRAVYRSRLLLDEDLAVREVSLARIYNDLGFEQRGLVEGWRSVNRDPSNYSAHRLLADMYSALPLHRIAQDSELLQAQLLQPLNTEPVQPRLAASQLVRDVGLTGAGLNEYTHLFVANGANLLADGVAGTQDTVATNVIASGIYNRYSVSVGQSHFQTDGFRTNNDLKDDIYSVFTQTQITPKSSLLAEFRLRDADVGDLNSRFWADNFFPNQRLNMNEKIYRVGARYTFSPGSTMIGTYAFNQLEPNSRSPGIESSREDTGHFVELRHIFQSLSFNVTGGIGFFGGDQNEETTSGSEKQREKNHIDQNNGYLYSQLDLTRDLLLTAGVSIDDFSGPATNQTQANPKVGIIWDLTPSTALRGAVFRTLKRNLVSSQTIEPTQVAGFNQFFDEPDGTDVWTFGVGLDQKLTDDFLVGAEITRRELSLPLEDPVSGKSDFDTDVTLGRGYLYWTPGDWFAVSAEYRYEDINEEEFFGFPQTKIRTQTVPLEARFFHPSGLFAGMRVSFVDQDGRFPNFLTGQLESDSDQFWLLDATVGYRLPRRYGLIALEAGNLLDERFKFQDIDVDRADQTTSPRRRILPERTILGRLILSF
jgi:tetratricopeptide (TPR) repeat protein